jgi:hypothetical protein
MVARHEVPGITRKLAPSSGTIEPILLTLGLTMTSTVPPGRSRFTSIPGTSCLATISLSLRDKSHSVPNFAPFSPGFQPSPWSLFARRNLPTVLGPSFHLR